ncbi:RNA-directed DNA polymerase, eukaryota, reverse transcriptase zinc-binding domain protein [Tanacetum coccineum]
MDGVGNEIGDKWRWAISEDGEFKVKELTRLVEEKILQVENGYQETIWNKLVPKKVNIFVWRALKGRLPVRVELDRRGIDLDSVLCPSCNNSVESCAHSLVTCDLPMSVWEKIFNWWKMGNVTSSLLVSFSHHMGMFTSPLISLVCGKRFFGHRDTSFGRKGMLCCNNSVESCAHSLVTFDLAMSVWDKIFKWWKLGIVNAFSIDEFFSSNGNINAPNYVSHVWQAVIWSTGYFIWKERNARVFSNKISSTNKIVQDIQLKSYEWIVRRSYKYKEIDWQQCSASDDGQFHLFELWSAASGAVALVLVELWSDASDTVASSSTSCL